MLRPLTIAGVVWLLLLSCWNLLAQEEKAATANMYQLELKDGSRLIGTIVKEDPASITFRTLSQVDMVIARDQIKIMLPLSGEMVAGEFWRRDPNRTRLLFAPTARPLKAGQGYFSVYEIFFPFVAVGVTDFLAVSGGMTLIPGAENQLFYFAPKVTPIQLKNLDLSGGFLYILVPEGEDNVGIAYTVSTYGTEKAALTVGLGWGFFGSDFADKPVLMLGGELRASSSVKFISENWFPPDTDLSFLSLGIRFFGENLAADFGLFFPAGADTGGFPFLPWIGFAYNFGKSGR
ncbi:hypothetical protein GWN26_03530 [Candidatus Saccharibacteria bacterium]|nr:hypothetical protein [Candidatus Saccharibacteria bacterium]NIW80565.1 hypothetical protein [Calditrichia bacterium]